ncbi:MAG: hypothetical protein JNL54_17585 [Kineosporiaceae bacterium]|nr:hypothetical protein [Kineosporiaceae bacterium]
MTTAPVSPPRTASLTPPITSPVSRTAVATARLIAVNTLYTVAFLLGTYWVWSALAALVLGHERTWPALWCLAMGVGTWTLLAIGGRQS